MSQGYFETLFPLRVCINLNERKDRWEKSQEEFNKLGIEVERFEAVKDNNPVIGCWQSHINSLKYAFDKKSNIFIFEDDVEFKTNLEKIDLSVKDLIRQHWTMFYLGGNILRPFFKVTENLARLSHCQSTHAYGVPYDALHPLIMFLEGNPGVNVDVLYADVIVPNNPCYISVPMSAIQRTSYSDIEKKDMTYELPERRYEHYLVEG